MAKKILIMEDEKILQSLLQEKLIKSGYDVRAVDDGQEGMEAMKEYKPNLILMDMLMPRMDGFEVLETMKREGLTETFPVIVISNSGQPVEVERVMSLGVLDFVVKVDFEPAEVIEKVKAFFAGFYDKPSEDSSTASEEEEEEEVPGEENGEEKPGDGINLLLVEDDEFIRGICELKLKKEGFHVTVSSDGLDALQKIKEGDYQLVLLDVILPGMNGFDILENVKKDPEKSHTPIIMLTNLGQESEVKKGLELGAEGYIVKAHFTVGEIIEKIKDILQGKNIAQG